MGPCEMNGCQNGQSIHFNNLFNHFIFNKDQRLHRLVLSIHSQILLQSWLISYIYLLLGKCISFLPHLLTVLKIFIIIIDFTQGLKRPFLLFLSSSPLPLPPFLCISHYFCCSFRFFLLSYSLY